MVPSQYIPLIDQAVVRNQTSEISLSRSLTTGSIFIFREAIQDKDYDVLDTRGTQRFTYVIISFNLYNSPLRSYFFIPILFVKKLRFIEFK